jgi:hypothetical protein
MNFQKRNIYLEYKLDQGHNQDQVYNQDQPCQIIVCLKNHQLLNLMFDDELADQKLF